MSDTIRKPLSPEDPMHYPLAHVRSRMTYSGPEDPPSYREWVVDLGDGQGSVSHWSGYRGESLAHRMLRAYLDPQATRRTIVEQMCACMREAGTPRHEIEAYRGYQGCAGLPAVCEWCAEHGHPQSCSPGPEYRPATTTRGSSRVCGAHAADHDRFHADEERARYEYGSDGYDD